MQKRIAAGEASRLIQESYGGELCPDWAFRRIIDKMERENRLEIQRVSRYRTIAESDLVTIANELRAVGRLEPATC